eukprot:EG_transcript_10810
MQLSSTLFGVLVVQVKPQLERLLRLPPDSLTKEIQLTQDLMDLFIRYQVPSDLLTACSEGEPVPSASEAVSRVKGHVKAMKKMIDAARKQELEEEAQRRMKRELEDRQAMAMQLEMDPQPRFLDEGGCEEDEQCFCDSEMLEECAAPVRRAKGGSAMGPAARLVTSLSSAVRKAPAAPAPTEGGGRPGPPPPVLPRPAPGGHGAPPPLVNHSSGPPSGSTDSPPAVQPLEEVEVHEGTPAAGGAGPMADYTRLPALLDAQFEALDVGSALRPTIITPGATWEKSSQAGLLSDMKKADVGAEEQKALRQQAMDLIDALSRSGTLAMADAQLHVVLAATHCFDQSLLDTVVQRNVNPVERVERSALIMAAAIHASPPAALLKPVQEARVREHSAILFQ